MTSTPSPYERPDEGSVRWLKSRDWYTDYHERLNERLNEIAPGTQIVAMPHEHMKIVTERCTLFRPAREEDVVVLLSGRSCHDDCDRLFREKKIKHVYTGYALDDDGLWRFHSWGFDAVDRRVFEATEPRLMYFGQQVDDAS